MSMLTKQPDPLQQLAALIGISNQQAASQRAQDQFDFQRNVVYPDQVAEREKRQANSDRAFGLQQSAYELQVAAQQQRQAEAQAQLQHAKNVAASQDQYRQNASKLDFARSLTGLSEYYFNKGDSANGNLFLQAATNTLGIQPVDHQKTQQEVMQIRQRINSGQGSEADYLRLNELFQTLPSNNPLAQ